MNDRLRASFGGTEVAYTVREGAPLLILVRMASRAMGIWDTVWDRLARRFTVANFDLTLPRTGEEESPRRIFERLAATAASVADGLGHEEFHLLGWNGGTHVALFAAHLYPERVKTCILLGPFREVPDMRPVWKGLDIMATMMSQPDVELYSYFWFMMGLSDSFVRDRFGEIERMAARRVAGDRFVTTDVERKVRWARSLRRNWLSDEELAGIRVPMLLVATELDKWGAGPNVAMAEALLGRLPAAQLAVIRGHGPLTLIEDPSPFLSICNRFLDRHLGTGGMS